MSDRATRAHRRDGSAFPPYAFEAYRSTRLRAPGRPLLGAPSTLSEATGPGPVLSGILLPDADLSRGPDGEALGERIIVTGTVFDEHGEPVPNTLIEVWQANAAGRYVDERDRHAAPLDPNFRGVGRVLTDGHGRYSLLTIKPGAYPWKNESNAWRPAHIHLSLFGPSFSTRLVTQMYFPGDPLHAQDPILNSIPDERARDRLIAHYAHDVTQPEWALGYRFDVVLAGRTATPFEWAGARG